MKRGLIDTNYDKNHISYFLLGLFSKLWPSKPNKYFTPTKA